MNDPSGSQQIDAIIQKVGGWRGEMLAQLRALIRSADVDLIEEVKWKKPSRPEGVPVWSHDGIICIGEVLKRAVRLTFPKRCSAEGFERALQHAPRQQDGSCHRLA